MGTKVCLGFKRMSRRRNRPAIFRRPSERNCRLIVEANRARQTPAFPSATVGATPPAPLHRQATKKRLLPAASFPPPALPSSVTPLAPIHSPPRRREYHSP